MPATAPSYSNSPAGSGPCRLRVSRRAFLSGLGTASAAMALAACSDRTSNSKRRADSTAQMVYQDWRTDWFPSMAQEMLDQFHAAHPNIHVFYAPDPENVGDDMLEDMQAGTAPDVVAGCCDFFPIWAQKGYLLDLRPFMEAELSRATLDDWDPAQLRALTTPDGAQYGLPKYHGALALFYNKDLLDRHRVPYPDGSWDHRDYLNAMRQIAPDRDERGKPAYYGSMVDISWDRIQAHVNGWGGHFVDTQDRRRSLLAQPEALAAMSWLRDRMWDDHSMASSLDVQDLGTRQAFARGRLAMVEEGSWALKDILEGAGFRLGVAPFPAGPVRRVTIASTDGFGIYSQTKYPEAAWEFMKFLIGADYGRAMARAHLLQPARASLVDEWASIVREQYPGKSADLDVATFADGQRKGYSVTAEVFANQAAARSLVLSAWQRIYVLGQASVDLMREVSVKVEDAQRSGA